MAYGTTDRLTGGTPTVCAGTAANAVDNNEATFWEHAAASPHFFQYDCGAGVSWAWGKLRVKNHNVVGATNFNVTGSNNGVDFDTLYSGSMAATLDWQEFTWVNSTAYRYIKINITSQQNAGDMVIYEFEAMEQLAVKSLGIGNPMIF
jgi:hypothetical protein